MQQRRPGNGGETFVKRLIALPGDRWREQNGYIYINGKKLNEPYVKAGSSRHGDESGEDRPQGPVPDARRQPRVVLRLAPLGHGSSEEPDRAGVRDLLAARGRDRLQVSPAVIG